MQGCRTEGYEGYKCKDARLEDTKDGGCCLVPMLRSLVAPTRGAGGYIYIYIHISQHDFSVLGCNIDVIEAYVNIYSCIFLC